METEFATTKEHATQLDLDLDNANNRINQLEWKLECCEREMELQAARAKNCAQAGHHKKLEARDELIALLKEKLSQKVDDVPNTNTRSGGTISGNGCTPADKGPKMCTSTKNQARLLRCQWGGQQDCPS